MKFEIHLPCDQLKPYIKHFVVSENDVSQSYKVLPGTSLVMGFQYTGGLSYFDNDKELPLAIAGITGIMDTYRVFKNSAVTGTVLVIFQETGAVHFFSNPLNELFRESVSLEHLFNPAVLREINERLSIAMNDKQRIGIIENLLLEQLRHVREDLLVNRALQFIYQSKGTIRINELAKKLHTSQSPLEKRFRRIVGASPKKFASIVRIKNMISALNLNNPQQADFLTAYYDQSHFIKDFKAFTSETPEQYLKNLKPPETVK